MATLPRTALKARVVDAPEILTVIDAIPHLAPFLTALYACDYKTLFQARPMCPISDPNSFLTALYACDYKTLFQARPMRTCRPCVLAWRPCLSSPIPTLIPTHHVRVERIIAGFLQVLLSCMRTCALAPCSW